MKIKTFLVVLLIAVIVIAEVNAGQKGGKKGEKGKGKSEKGKNKEEKGKNKEEIVNEEPVQDQNEEEPVNEKSNKKQEKEKLKNHKKSKRSTEEEVAACNCPAGPQGPEVILNLKKVSFLNHLNFFFERDHLDLLDLLVNVFNSRLRNWNKIVIPAQIKMQFSSRSQAK